MRWFPGILGPGSSRYFDYWYFSFRVFFAQGFTDKVSSVGLLALQVGEFAFGLVLVALMIGSVTRKLSA
jgi:hypothetical protein